MFVVLGWVFEHRNLVPGFQGIIDVAPQLLPEDSIAYAFMYFKPLTNSSCFLSLPSARHRQTKMAPIHSFRGSTSRISMSFLLQGPQKWTNFYLETAKLKATKSVTTEQMLERQYASKDGAWVWLPNYR